MATITLRQGVGGKGSPLTNAEVDANFSNLNTDKVETSDAVSTNTANKVVKRDASGNFSAGTITAALSGNASTATILATSRNINGVAFNGSESITVTAAATTLTGTELNSSVVTSSLTALGTVTTGTWSATNIALGKGGTNAALTAAAGGVVYSTASAMAITGAGEVGQVLISNGTSAPSWATISAGALTITDDTTTDASYYPALMTATSGSQASGKVSSTSLYFNPSTGTLNATVFNSLSDINQKTNIVKIENATDTLKQIDGFEFDWVSNGKHSAGVVAQYLEKILPFLVNTNEKGIKSVNYSGLIAYLIESNKELARRIEVLENK